MNKIRAPISAVSEITGINESKLNHDYRELIGEKFSSIPLEALPFDVLDQYVSDYLLPQSYLDLDPFALQGYMDNMQNKNNHFPIANTPNFRSFANQVNVVRESQRIFLENAGSCTAVEEMKKLASDNCLVFFMLNAGVARDLSLFETGIRVDFTDLNPPSADTPLPFGRSGCIE